MIPLYDLNPHRRFPWVTLLIIAANIGALLWQGIEPTERNQEIVYRFGFIPKRVTELRTGKPLVVQPEHVDRQGRVVKGRPIQLSVKPAEVYLTFFTAMFLHGGLIHLGMNMWMLWIFGNNVEDRLGWFMYLCFYFTGGIAGTFCQWLADPQVTVPMIGASGAVAAVLGGYAITYPKAMVKTMIIVGLIFFVDLPALVVLGIWFLLQMAAGLNIMRDLLGGEHVAFWAHIGGFVAGIILMPILGLGASPPGADWKQEVKELFDFDPVVRRNS
ncbi:MAG: rhomboid family intramembrane serine protease [Pirellulales bacterium]